jgi:hypothetical protein
VTLNPDTALSRIRRDLATYGDILDNPGDDPVAELLAVVRDLDAHLSAGGIPPEAWREGPDAPADVRACSCGEADYGTPGHDGAGYWIVTDAAGQEYRGRFATEQEAEDEAEAVRVEEGEDAPVSVAYVNA